MISVISEVLGFDSDVLFFVFGEIPDMYQCWSNYSHPQFIYCTFKKLMHAFERVLILEADKKTLYSMLKDLDYQKDINQCLLRWCRGRGVGGAYTPMAWVNDVDWFRSQLPPTRLSIIRLSCTLGVELLSNSSLHNLGRSLL